MAKQIIDTGIVANDKKGDTIKTAFTKVNENFTELYASINISDISQLTDSTHLIPTDIKQLADSESRIPTDIGQLSDTGHLLTGGAAAITDINQLTDTDNRIASDISQLSDSTNRIPVDINQLSNTSNLFQQADLGEFVFAANELSLSSQNDLTVKSQGTGVLALESANGITLRNYNPGNFDHTWQFGINGNLTFPSGALIIADSLDGTYLVANPGVDGYAGITDVSYSSWMWTANDGTAHISTDAGTWSFNANGTTLFPNNTLKAPADTLTIRSEIANGNANSRVEFYGNSISIGSQDDHTGTNPAWAWINTDVSVSGEEYANIIIKRGDTGAEHTWNFNADGNTTLPTNGNLAVSGTTYSYNLSSAGTSSLTVATVAGTLDVTGATTLSSTLSAGASTLDSLDVTNDATVGGTLDVTGASTLDSLDVTNDATVGGTLDVTGETTLGNTTVNGTFTLNGTTQYIVAENSVYTDNLLEIHAPSGGVGESWTTNDGKDVGIRMHYYNGTADKNAALFMDNGDWTLKWVVDGTETNGQFTHSGFGDIQANKFIGALQGNADTATNGVVTTGSYTDPSWLTINYSKLSGTVPTWNQNTTGTAANLSGTQTAKYFYAAPNASNGTASFRTILASDLPTISYTDLSNKPTIYTSAYIGTTNIAFNRSSASQTLTGVSIDGNAATATSATTATNANNINISTNNGNPSGGEYQTPDTTMYPVLVGSSSTGNQLPHIDYQGLSYNASTNALTATIFVGALTGTASLASDVAGGNTNQILYQSSSNNTSFITAPTNNTHLTYTTGGGFAWSAITSTTDANSLTGTTLASNVVNSSLTSVGTLSSLTVSGTANMNGLTQVQQLHIPYIAKSNASSTVTHDCSAGQIFYHTTPSANFTANFTNLNLANGYTTEIKLIIVQGSTPRIPNAVQIAGSTKTIGWLGNSTPSGTANRTEIVTFKVLLNGTNYSVFGKLESYGNSSNAGGGG